MFYPRRPTNRPPRGSVDVFNVLDYGADDTGVEASHVQITNAINDAVNAGGGVVLFPPGTYKTTASLALPGNVILLGAGCEASIISFAPGSAIWAIQVDGTSVLQEHGGVRDMTINVASPAAGVIRITGHANFYRLENLDLEGYNQTTPTGIQLDGENSSNSHHTLSGIKFRTLRRGLSLSGFANANYVEQCWFGLVTTGIDFSTIGTDVTAGSDNLIARCEFSGAGVTESIRLSSVSFRNVFLKCVCDGPIASVVGASTRTDCTFVGCWLNPSVPAGLISATGTVMLGSSYESNGSKVDPLLAGNAIYLRGGGGGFRAFELLGQESGPQARLRISGGGDGDEMSFLTSVGATSKITFQTGSPLATSLQVQNHDISALLGNLIVSTAGKGLQVKEGSNAKMGTAVLVAGSKVVSTTAVTANSRIFLCSQADGGTPGFLRVSARSAGTSFTITSSNGADTSTVAWIIVEPAP